ncbi:hypothetical protein C8Q76DRAFT_390579 [Earliella scabrosa]|nr:hypothetical protein C8Q76DRAFT_390579 [Earliella scabrosa]
MLSIIFTLVSLSAMSLAEFTPTAPGPGDTFKAGSTCTIQWEPDTSGKWTNVSIHLMTGSNDNMTRVTRAASCLDGTDQNLSPFKWTCPDVDPYSAIYFYQFTNGDDLQASKWTTRFTITSPSGDTEPPEHKSQPNGDAVPWGEGRLRSDHKKTFSDPATSQNRQKSVHKEDGADGRGSADETNSVRMPPESSTSRTHKHPKSTTTPCPSDADQGSSSADATEESASTPTSHRTHSSGSENVKASVPTADLPADESHSSRMHTRTSTASRDSGSSAPCSQMGPGVPDMVGGMQLASSGNFGRDGSWLKTLSVTSFIIAMWL